jgi:protein-S-isoprenylcysteine O-methyltransferase Ste14
MISAIVLIIFLLLVFLVASVVIRAIISNQQIIGRPPIPVLFFILAKLLVVVNLSFLLLRGLNISVYRIFASAGYIDSIALVFLITGTAILFLSTFKLKSDLVFGLSSSDKHKLQTNGIYSLSRHPFYLGFIFILLSSCLLTPHYLNILAFLGAWIIHHFIMIKEEEFLSRQYGDEYIQYIKKVKRYITF